MRSSLPAAAAALSLSVLLLAGCTGPSDVDPSRTPSDAPTPTAAPTPSITVSPPTAPDALPRDAASVQEWAALALPENALGGSSAIARGTGQVGESGASVTLPADASAFDVVIACQSVDGSPLTVSFGAGSAASEIPCSAPEGDQPAPTRVAIQSGAVLVDATTDAVYAYEVQPRSGT